MGIKSKSAIAGKSEIEEAIDQLCDNCHDIFSDTSGRYAGRFPCYNCIKMLVAVNLKAAGKFTRKGGAFEVIVVDLILGFGKGLVMGFVNLIEVGLAGKGIQEAAMALFKLIAFPFITIIDASVKFRQMKQANAIVANDSQTLKEIRDFISYTQLKMKQKNNSGTLNENTYEIAVINIGEKAAKAELCRKVNQVFVNSTILMNFDNTKKST